MPYTMADHIRDNSRLRDSFNALAIKTFELSFESWYKSGYWTDKYIPYALLDGEKVIANASVNIMDTVWQGQPRRYIQLGTIMTDAAYRHKGLSRRLIETILEDWHSKCDAIYLFANDTVLDFYPKFGFQKVMEYQCHIPAVPQAGKVRRLDMSSHAERDLLAKHYARSNPFSALPMIGNLGLIMFYCSALMKESVYYCEDFDAVIIAEQNGDSLTCYDIYSDGSIPLLELISAMESPQTSRVLFGFPLKDIGGGSLAAIESGDDTLFILNGKENIFQDNQLMFPTLSHA